MFKEMRRTDRKLTDDQVNIILNKGEYGILSTISENGYPYGIPISYVFFKNCIYFHSAVNGHKLENISNNNLVSFTIVGNTCVLPEKFSTFYESVIIFGKANEIYVEEKNKVLLELVKKYSFDFIESGKEYINRSSEATKVFKVEIEHTSGKGNHLQK